MIPSDVVQPDCQRSAGASRCPVIRHPMPLRGILIDPVSRVTRAGIPAESPNSAPNVPQNPENRGNPAKNFGGSRAVFFIRKTAFFRCRDTFSAKSGRKAPIRLDTGHRIADNVYRHGCRGEGHRMSLIFENLVGRRRHRGESSGGTHERSAGKACTSPQPTAGISRWYIGIIRSLPMRQPGEPASRVTDCPVPTIRLET